MKLVVGFIKSLFNRLFHTRSIIIISEHKTKHVAISGPIQFGIVSVLVTCVVWASFSTGQYMATQSALEKRDETIKSVANSRIDTNFNYALANMPSQNLGPLSPTAMIKPLTDPTYTLSAVNQDKLFARIALLENKVRELKHTNTEIIQTVREKTNEKILNMEEIIRQTGLSPSKLKNEARAIYRQEQKNGSNQDGEENASGGPYIPASYSSPTVEKLVTSLDAQLEKLAILNTIVERLPLGVPVPESKLQSNFGRRVDPFTRRLAFHGGVDMSGPDKAEVFSSGPGVVRTAGWKGAYGNTVDIDHGFGIVTRYGHLSKVLVGKGDAVAAGDLIGIQGSTGRSTGPHLHYEVRVDGKPVNPTTFLKAGYHVSQAE